MGSGIERERERGGIDSGTERERGGVGSGTAGRTGLERIFIVR